MRTHQNNAIWLNAFDLANNHLIFRLAEFIRTGVYTCSGQLSTTVDSTHGDKILETVMMISTWYMKGHRQLQIMLFIGQVDFKVLCLKL